MCILYLVVNRWMYVVSLETKAQIDDITFVIAGLLDGLNNCLVDINTLSAIYAIVVNVCIRCHHMDSTRNMGPMIVQGTFSQPSLFCYTPIETWMIRINTTINDCYTHTNTCETCVSEFLPTSQSYSEREIFVDDIFRN